MLSLTDGTSFSLANKANGPPTHGPSVAAVYESGVAQTIYVDGVSFVSAAPPATMNMTNVAMNIGWHAFGAIDEVRCSLALYSR